MEKDEIIEPPTKKRKTLEIDINKLDHIIKCGICLDYLNPDSKSCINGHLICMECYKRCSQMSNYDGKCSQCKSRFFNCKSKIISDLYESLDYKIKCCHTKCSEECLIKDYWEHKNKCLYRDYKCDIVNCSDIHPDNVEDLLKHYYTKHQYKTASIDPNLKTDNHTCLKLPWDDICDKNKFAFKYNDEHIITLEILDNNNFEGVYLQKKCDGLNPIILNIIPIGHYSEDIGIYLCIKLVIKDPNKNDMYNIDIIYNNMLISNTCMQEIYYEKKDLDKKCSDENCPNKKCSDDSSNKKCSDKKCPDKKYPYALFYFCEDLKSFLK